MYTCDCDFEDLINLSIFFCLKGCFCGKINIDPGRYDYFIRGPSRLPLPGGSKRFDLPKLLRAHGCLM